MALTLGGGGGGGGVVVLVVVVMAFGFPRRAVVRCHKASPNRILAHHGGACLEHERPALGFESYGVVRARVGSGRVARVVRVVRV
jgi:hypothetical protein